MSERKSEELSTEDYLRSNRALWDKLTPVHVRSDFYHVDTFKAGDNRLRDYEIEEVGDVTGKDLLHLQCHFGLDTLSWARLGARVTGIDFSSAAIAEARSLAEQLGIAATFVVSDLYQLPAHLEGDFDVVYTSRGVLGWLPDLTRWAEVIAHFLRPGGVFYVTEAHPLLWIFDDDEGVTDLRVRYDYFSTEVLPFEVKGSYADTSADVDHDFEYGWNHTLGDIVTSLADQRLTIELLHEFPYLEWPAPFLVEGSDGRWVLPRDRTGGIPLMFSLRAVKGDRP